ncbi:MAG TPA: transposase [Phototrophicaceae bacterium]|jgi:REP element-mobilizing transposase RayT|nr:transposase [Phototrophicaceae bacterium]
MPEQFPQRKSPRLRDYDYAQSGAYFVTICTHQRFHWFGQIANSTASLSSIGMIAAECWYAIPQHYPTVELDGFVVMPNHTHGIIVLAEPVTPVKPSSPLLATVIGTYKAAVTRQIKRNHPSWQETLWQGRFHDHIIRDEATLNYIRQYIEQNPSRWEEDSLFSPS